MDDKATTQLLQILEGIQKDIALIAAELEIANEKYEEIIMRLTNLKNT